MTDPAVPVPVPAPAPAPSAGSGQAPVPAPAENLITIDDFRKVHLRVGKIIDATEHTNANKLLVITVDLGTEKRQIVSGIRQYYPDPKALIGKSAIIVANLQPAVIRGVESRGMLLAAAGAGDVSILQTIREVPPGSPVT